MTKVGRNDACPCGSGKKYKSCCMESSSQQSTTLVDTTWIDSTINQADRLYQQGKLNAARELYQAVLQKQADNAQAVHFLGVIAFHENRNEIAEQLMKRSVELNPKVAEYFSNLGALQLAMKKNGDAIASFKAALKIKPQFTNAMMNLGSAMVELGKMGDAIEWYKKTIQTDPNYDKAYNGIGTILLKQFELTQAIQYFQYAIRIDPTQATYYTNIATALIEMGQWDQAIPLCQKAIELDPRQDDAYNNLGVISLNNYNYQDSLNYFQRAAEIAPNNPLYQANIAGTYSELKQFEQAITYCQKALALDPQCVHAYEHLGVACQELGQLTMAEGFLSKAAELNPNNSDNQLNLGLTRLAMGKFESGWSGYEYRWKKRGAPPYPDFTCPIWQGKPAPDKTILVFGEQGIGDQIMFASMYEELSHQFKKTIFMCNPKLMTIFSRSFPNAEIMSSKDKQKMTEIEPTLDLHSAQGSLARWLRPNAASFPRADAFLIPDPQRVSYWKTRLAELGPAINIGICWRSGDKSGNRSLYWADIQHWGPILSTPGVRFVNLQYDECSEEIASAKKMFNVDIYTFPEVDLFNDIDEAAALTKSMDMVISSPTAAAILAASLGVPTWWMLCGFDWQKCGTPSNVWYRHLRLFEKNWGQSWDEIIKNLSTELKHWVSTS